MPKRSDTRKLGGPKREADTRQAASGHEGITMGARLHPLPFLCQCLWARANWASPGTWKAQHAQTVVLSCREPHAQGREKPPHRASLTLHLEPGNTLTREALGGLKRFPGQRQVGSPSTQTPREEEHLCQV